MTRTKRWNYEELLGEAERSESLLIAECANQRRQLNRLVRSGELFTPAPSVYVRKDYWRERNPAEKTMLLARALATVHPNWVFCGATAALLGGLEVPYSFLGHVHVAANRHYPGRSVRGVERIVVGDTKLDSRITQGVRVVSPELAAIECMATSSFSDGLALADSLLRTNEVARDDLIETIRSMKRFAPRVERLVAIASYADARSESGGESIARGVMIEQGFPVPDIQFEIPDPLSPDKTFRGDYHWDLPEASVIGELDGMDKYLNTLITREDDLPRRLAKEKRREARLYMAGHRVARFGMPEVRNVRALVELLEGFGVPRHDARGLAVPKGTILLGSNRVVCL